MVCHSKNGKGNDVGDKRQDKEDDQWVVETVDEVGEKVDGKERMRHPHWHGMMAHGREHRRQAFWQWQLQEEQDE